MQAINTPEPVSISGLYPNEAELMANVVDALKTWDHQAARAPWRLLIESRARYIGVPSDMDIKRLIWYAIQKACLTCASRGENEFMRLVEDLANASDDVDLGSLESHSTIDKEHQLSQMVLTISKKLYDIAVDVTRNTG